MKSLFAFLFLTFGFSAFSQTTYPPPFFLNRWDTAVDSNSVNGSTITNLSPVAVIAAVPSVTKTNFIVPSASTPLPTLRAQAPAFIGQLAEVQSGTLGAFYISAASTTSAGGFNLVPFWPDGFGNIGSPSGMNAFSPSGVHWYFNGSPAASTRSPIGEHNESYLFVHNMNPYTDGAGICIPMSSTNVIGQAVLTNTSGEVIYESPYGNQLLTISPEFPEYETNQAGSEIWLGDGNWPMYISINATMPGEAGGFFSQHYFAGFDFRGNTNSAYPLGVHFPKWVPYVWTYTNANNVDALFVNEKTGDIAVNNRIYLANGGIYATNTDVSIIGPSSGLAGVSGAALYLTTNVAWTPLNANFTAFTFDGQGNARTGWLLQFGQYAKIAAANGSPLTFAHSSASSLMAGTQTITNDMTIQNGSITNFDPTILTNVGNIFAGSGSNLIGTTAVITSSNASVTISQSVRPSDGRTNYDLSVSGGGGGITLQDATNAANGVYSNNPSSYQTAAQVAALTQTNQFVRTNYSGIVNLSNTNNVLNGVLQSSFWYYLDGGIPIFQNTSNYSDASDINRGFVVGGDEAGLALWTFNAGVLTNLQGAAVVGSLTNNTSGTAARATADAAGNTFTTTYANLTQLSSGTNAAVAYTTTATNGLATITQLTAGTNAVVSYVNAHTNDAVSDARLSSNVPLKNVSNTFSNNAQIVEQFNLNTNTYGVLALKNSSTGGSASGEFSVQADNGTTTNNFISLGINSSQFTNSALLPSGTNMAYILVMGNAKNSNNVANSGSLTIAVAQTNSVLNFSVGSGLTSTNMQLNSSNLVLNVGIVATNLINNSGITNAGQSYLAELDVTGTNLFFTTQGLARTYSTNAALVSATSLIVNFSPAFADTNYVITAPNDLVGATAAPTTTNSFTLTFTAATVTATIQGAVIHK